MMIFQNFELFMKKSEHFFQTQWNTIWEWFENDEFNMIVWGTFIFTTAIFWIIALCFLRIDLSGRPQFIRKYRIQKSSSYPVTLNRVASATKQILFNQFVCGLPIAFLYYHLLVWRGYDSKRTLPSIQKIASEFLLFIFLEEILFYYIHRLLHTPLLFKHVHKIHHKWNSPIAIIAAYCHPVEHVLNNMLPILLGPLLLGSHLATLWLWFSAATWSGMMSHSGFQLPQFPNPDVHDLHHLKPVCNFGVLGILDRIHGTYVSPRRDKFR